MLQLSHHDREKIARGIGRERGEAGSCNYHLVRGQHLNRPGTSAPELMLSTLHLHDHICCSIGATIYTWRCSEAGIIIKSSRDKFAFGWKLKNTLATSFPCNMHEMQMHVPHVVAAAAVADFLMPPTVASSARKKGCEVFVNICHTAKLLRLWCMMIAARWESVPHATCHIRRRQHNPRLADDALSAAARPTLSLSPSL